MTGPTLLIAGIGNIFLGDDAFGSEVARLLAARPQPAGVRVVDFGIRSLDLVYAMLDDYRMVILIDAMPRGGVPGTLYVLEVEDAKDAPAPDVALAAHGMNPTQVLQAARALGSPVQRVLVVGCEPGTPPDELAPTMTLSESVQEAVPQAMALVESLRDCLLLEAVASSR